MTFLHNQNNIIFKWVDISSIIQSAFSFLRNSDNLPCILFHDLDLLVSSWLNSVTNFYTSTIAIICVLLTALYQEAYGFTSIQSLSHVWLFATPWTAAHHASLSIPDSRSLLTHFHWVGDAIQPSHPLSSPPPVFSLSQHQCLLQWVSSSHQVAKSIGVSASASVLPMNT